MTVGEEETERVAALAAAAGLVLPVECLRGVADALAALADHAARLHALPLPGDPDA